LGYEPRGWAKSKTKSKEKQGHMEQPEGTQEHGVHNKQCIVLNCDIGRYANFGFLFVEWFLTNGLF
jgi:hypothetical protein